MITSTYAPTATGRVVPRLALDFTTGVLDPRITVTRALNTATRVNSLGVIELVNADLPRFDYDPVTFAPKGLLIEEARTNALLNSVLSGGVSGTPGTAPTSFTQFLTGSPVVSYASSANYPAGFGVSITTTSADRFQLSQTVSVSANTTYTLSVVADCVVPPSLWNVVGLVGAPVGSTVTLFINGIARAGGTLLPVGRSVVSATVVVGGTAGTVQCRIGNGIAGGFAGQLTLSCPQSEVGAFATSYIPTTTTSLTRNADVATITGTNFSGFWKAGKGSALVRARPSTVSGTRPWVQFDDATADNIIALRGNTTNPELYIRASGSDQAQIDAGTIAANARYRLAGAWATNDCAASINSGAAVRDGVATIPVVTQARLGSDGTNYLNGHLEAIEYYEERVLNASLQVVSSAAGYRSIIGPVFRDTIIS
jgi:hypothetical protein